MSKSTLERFQDWYAAQCYGDWEHGSSISIGSLDNPGWTVRIDLEGTELEHATFFGQARETPESWFHCRVDGTVFTAACGPHDLETVLTIFLDWARPA